MPDGRQKDWRELCIAHSPKLSSLVEELIEALDKGQIWYPEV